MHVVAGQYSFDNLNKVFSANLPDDLSHAQPDITLQDHVAIFGDPHLMIARMIESAVLAIFLESMIIHLLTALKRCRLKHGGANSNKWS
jgi:hypothetical protein